MMPVITRVARDERSAWKTPLTVVSFTILFSGAASLVIYWKAGTAIALLFSHSYETAISVVRIYCVAAFSSSISMALANFVVVPRGFSQGAIMLYRESARAPVQAGFWDAS